VFSYPGISVLQCAAVYCPGCNVRSQEPLRRGRNPGPAQPVKIVGRVRAGSAADILARLVGKQMGPVSASRSWSKPTRANSSMIAAESVPPARARRRV